LRPADKWEDLDNDFALSAPIGVRRGLAIEDVG